MSDPLTRRSDDPLTTPDPAATPDTTGLREVPDLLAALQRSVDAAKAARAAHPTPDASPDPAVVQREQAERFLQEWARPYFGPSPRDAVAAVMRAATAAGFGDVRAVEAERDRASAGRDLWRQSHALMRQRAEAAEKELADLRERVEAVGPVTLSHGWAGYRSEFVPLTELRAALIPGAGEDRG